MSSIVEATGRRLLLSVRAEDCVWQFLRGTGPGGQHRNKASTAARCVHPPSGAVGFAQDSRSQLRNRRAAFLRMIETREFQDWHRVEVARCLGRLAGVEERVDREMLAVRVERVEDGRWVEWAPEG